VLRAPTVTESPQPVAALEHPLPAPARIAPATTEQQYDHHDDEQRCGTHGSPPSPIWWYLAAACSTDGKLSSPLTQGNRSKG
jgi:hypothetical protein